MFQRRTSTRQPWSLQKRLVLAFGVLLVLFLGLAGIVLDRVYKESVAAAAEERLQLRIFALLSVAEPEGEGLYLPELEDSRFSQIDSGLYGVILDEEGNEVWRSPSALNLSLGDPHLLHDNLHTGETRYGRLLAGELGELVWASYGTYWEDEDRGFAFVALESSEPSTAQIRAFQSNLSLWFGGLALLLSVAQYLLLRWGMQPLQRLAGDVSAIERGERDTLDGHYPSELLPVTANLDMLIKSERDRQGRYRTTLGDLAHSLKTPLAVMSSALQEASAAGEMKPAQLQEMEEQLARMNDIVSYQLRRAVRAKHAPVLGRAAVQFTPLLDKLLTVLGKVYRDKPMQVDCEVAPGAVFHGEESDLTEVLGNLLDNAFKYGRSRIRVVVSQAGGELRVLIDDDGNGIDERDRTRVLQRGARADTVTSGQGIGLSVVVDIVSAYGGGITVGRNAWGGASIALSFVDANAGA